jgi:hypothetical protein
VAAALCTPVVAHGQWLPWKKKAHKAQPAASPAADSARVDRAADSSQAPSVTPPAAGDSARQPASPDTTRARSDSVTLPGIGVMVRPGQSADSSRYTGPIYIPRLPSADSAPPPARAADSSAATPPADTEPPRRTEPPPAREGDSTAARADTTPAPGTHVVKKGDTLWDLARLYLSDPFQWPEIYRLNTDVVEDPHWIFPGERLRLPGASAQRDVASVQDTSSDDRPTMLSATVFNKAEEDARPQVTQPSRRPTLVGMEPVPAVRAGEVYGAPWVDRRGGPAERGRIIVAVDPSVIKASTERQRFQLYDRLYADLPDGANVRPGDRFISVAEGPELGGDAQIMVPTGVVRVERPGDGEAATVEVIAQYGEIRRGQVLIPYQRFPIPVDVQPTPRELGIHSRVLWIPSGAVLPSLLHYVVLDARLKDGVVIGDQFTLLRARTRSEDGDVLPAEPVAVVQVVRVTERGATAVVVGQRHPAIREGMEARLTAKMP